MWYSPEKKRKSYESDFAFVGTRILSVEDDERIRTAVRLALEDEGWTVDEAENGEEALVKFAQSPTDVVRKRIKDRARANPDLPELEADYIRELNEAYNHFFFHYSATPLLVVETSQMDLSWGDETIDELLRQLKSLTHGTRYYVPRT